MDKRLSGWIWMPEYDIKEENEAAFFCFRKNMVIDDIPKSFRIKISADSRYKLYINEKFCEAGPSKGDDKIWFYDEVDVTPYLKCGENEWKVVVLRYPIDTRKGNQSIFRTETPGLFIESTDWNEQAQVPAFYTDASWKVCRLSGIQIVSENPFFAPLQIYEQVDARKNRYDWKSAMEYKEADIAEILRRNCLKKRDIPLEKRTEKKFIDISKMIQSSFDKDKWMKFLDGEQKLEIPAYSEECLEISAGELMTGYLQLALCGGAGTEIKLLQSEGYVVSIPENPKNFDDLPVKGDRSDSVNGVLAGYTDTYIVEGCGTEEQPEIYEPFWFRTFRYIRLQVVTKENPVVLRRFTYQETGYPLEIRSQVWTSDPVFESIWDVSERTLRRCMHETYMDCPFYEQLQYGMDARSQIIYTYAVSADARLARRCMEDFRRSQREDGLLNGCYPSVQNNIIPGFSIYYIAMLYDYMMYFGDKEFLCRHLTTAKKILAYFAKHLNEKGLVEKVGGLNRPGNHWSFIDWTMEWNDTNGVPPATLKGPITMESFLYLLGLQYAEKIAVFLGKTKAAEEWAICAANLQCAINAHCRGENGMYQDGPGIEQYSQHCQVFAILTNTVRIEKGKKYLLETLKYPERYAQCSVAMMYYLFRALEKCDCYGETEKLWENWKIMIRNHMTTCAEDPIHSRSDCHAWGALALYELPTVILGVRPAKPGYRKVEIKPHTEYISKAEGEVITPAGMIRVSWKKEQDKINMKISVPEGMEILSEE